MKLSIIIPCYNAVRFLKLCIESIQFQAGESIEIICVNDGSKDNTLGLLRELSTTCSSLVVVDQPNAGSAAARNKGFSIAQGEYVWFVDADDLIAADAVKTIIETLDSSGCDSVIFGLEQIDEDGNVVKPYVSEYATRHIVKGYEAYIKENIPSFPWNRAFRRDFLEENKILFRSLRPDDEDFDLRTYVYSKKTIFLNKCLYSYRIVAMSDSRNPNAFQKYFDGYLAIMGDYLKIADRGFGSNEFWMKVAFNCYKNMYGKLRGYELNIGPYKEKNQLFANMKVMMSKQLKAFGYPSIYAYLVKAACVFPYLGYKMLRLAYLIKKGK